MKALVYDDYCDLQGMRLADIPDPAPGPDEVLVEVMPPELTRSTEGPCRPHAGAV